MEEVVDLIYNSIGVFLFCIGVTVMVMGMKGIALLEHQTSKYMYQQHVLSVYDGWSD